MTAAVAAAASNAVAATKVKELSTTSTGSTQFTINGASVPSTAYTMTGNGAVDALNLASQANKDLAAAAGVTMNAVHAYASEVVVTLNAYANNATTDASERYTDASGSYCFN